MTKLEFEQYLEGVLEEVAQKYGEFGREHPECLHNGSYYMDIVFINEPDVDKNRMYCRASTADGKGMHDAIDKLRYHIISSENSTLVRGNQGEIF